MGHGIRTEAGAVAVSIVRLDLGLSSRVWLVVLLAGLAAIGVAASAGAEAVPGAPEGALACSGFDSQADAQARFAELGGSPAHPVGALDGDRDGIACEGLPAPYGAYATVGYNRRGHFLYGTASMPAAGTGEETYPCLFGDRKGPLGARHLNVYRVEPGGDRPILGLVRAEARPESGRLLWKAPRATLAPGVYYVAFEERIRMAPYGPNECPGFRSSAVPLPRPQATAS